MSSKGFHDYYWHDAVIHNIAIDRSNPGRMDQVVVDIEWPDGEMSSMCFYNCRAASMAFNFGVVAPESILTASESSDSERLRAVRAQWAPAGITLESLREFEIEANSTASKIIILAEGWTETALEVKG